MNYSYAQQAKYTTTGTIDRLNDAVNSIINLNAKVEIIAKGFKWSEGPLWVEKEKMLLFSDVPMNTVYKWTEEEGTSIYLQPSGYTGTTPYITKEPGSNGLLLNKQGQLVLCQHGNRQIGLMDAPLNAPEPRFISLGGYYNDRRFNSPNDAVYNCKGELFFTDPPYGLPAQNDTDPIKEIPFNGVYKIKKGGKVILLTDKITRPNGIALMPGEKQLIVASSDGSNPNWYIFDVKNDTLVNERLLYPDIAVVKGVPGLPDGLKIDKKGNIFATGPGGVWIFDSNGSLSGKINLAQAASNVALSADEKTLYITNSGQVLRVIMRN